MPRTARSHFSLATLILALIALPLHAQQSPPPPQQQEQPKQPPPPAPSQQPTGQINPRIPPPPPQEETAKPAPEKTEAPLPAPPEKVTVPAGSRIEVALDTPLSTRISKQGQLVKFLTAQPIALADGLEIPTDTAFTGTVVKMKRPGAFRRPGEIHVKVERIELAAGTPIEVAASLNTPDPKQGRIPADSNRGATVITLATWTLDGMLIGSLGGGKGAGIGAGAGAAAALIWLASARGADVYLEPGMPFMIILDKELELQGKDVQNAQQDYLKHHPAGENDRSVSDPVFSEPGRPQLKRRPRRP